MGTLAIAIVVLNALVLAAHNRAHQELGVDLNAWQQAFVYTVIVPGPILGLLLIRSTARLGYAVLLISMLGSLVFGVYHHYAAVSPDHVSHLPPGDAQDLFRVTAALMVMVQAAGTIVAAVALAQPAPELPLPRR